MVQAVSGVLVSGEKNPVSFVLSGERQTGESATREREREREGERESMLTAVTAFSLPMEDRVYK